MNFLLMTSPAPERAGFYTTEKRPPLGLGYLMAVLKNNGHQVYFSDEYLVKSNVLTSDFLTENKIDVVGLYVNTVCYEGAMSILQRLDQLRKTGKWRGQVYVGGPHTSANIDTVPDFVDKVFVGEAEISLLSALESNSSPRIVSAEPVENLDDLPFPAWEEFIHRSYDWTHRWLEGTSPVYTMNTSRGCPFGCTFCSVKSVWGKSYRFMSGERIFSDVSRMIKYYGARAIYFREDHFTLNKKRVIDFCQLILKNGIKIQWMCETRARDIVDVDFVKLMYAAGCRVVFVGVESGSQKILDRINKGESLSDFQSAFEICKKVGIKTYASFVVGLPFETEDDINLTNLFIDLLQPDFYSKNVYVGIPGSELYQELLENRSYEYRDSSGIIYPVGYKNNIRKYYKNDYFEVYSAGVVDRLRLTTKNIARKAVNFRLSDFFQPKV